MQLQDEISVPASAHEAYELAREHLVLLGQQMPDVDSIEPIARRVIEDGIVRTDRFRASVAPVPLGGRVFSTATWLVHSRFADRGLRANWHVDVERPAGALVARGDIHFVGAASDQTVVQLTGHVSIDAAGLGFGTGFVAKRLTPIAERLIASAIRRNFAAMMQLDPSFGPRRVA